HHVELQAELFEAVGEHGADHAAELDFTEADVPELVEHDVAELSRIGVHYLAQLFFADRFEQSLREHGEAIILAARFPFNHGPHQDVANQFEADFAALEPLGNDSHGGCGSLADAEGE